MIADFRKALDDGGTSVTLDGESLTVFISPVETDPADFEYTSVTVQKVFHLPEDLGDKVVGGVVTLDGKRWEVTAHRIAGVSKCLTLMRSHG